MVTHYDKHSILMHATWSRLALQYINDSLEEASLERERNKINIAHANNFLQDWRMQAKVNDKMFFIFVESIPLKLYYIAPTY